MYQCPSNLAEFELTQCTSSTIRPINILIFAKRPHCSGRKIAYRTQFQIWHHGFKN
uniref:Uncharacterized protein n=1 Tax=Rhizophora mucronata TaxID=61149 RepID=A0A2P2QKY0_RHIMU